MALVNGIRALGSTKWDDNKVVRKMLRTYRAKNNMLASMIIERFGYDEMIPQEVLLKLKHHECLDEDAINAHNQNPNAMRYNKSTTLKATQAHEGKSSSQEKKKVKDDSSSEEEESDEEVVLIIRNLRKFIKKKSNRKTYDDGKRRNKKRFCYGCGQTSHFIADCPNEKKHKHDKDEDKNKVTRVKYMASSRSLQRSQYEFDVKIKRVRSDNGTRVQEHQH
ncbi:uncharacterized protein [Miscanthus floridulus]|uniref:uncharacterized protein n=1 Tax=Miscanthus floridulus TaxID=154761 RepID=UPI003458F709